ncbi:hypothetical protein AVHY2522_23360 [Acidovorax sp. SUPP2522]|uniref:hypothetical protein n=1 Tax=unclassified Acidovorax TaxID=2684926 RepID=UPI00234AF68B|nr:MULTISPECIES: hypothetical protein [unclassified Acidovorax]WCM96063.1 hypothetical protein M5C96_16605 [Acidovorax sp. GBBC 1281]GKT19681.1 hypothetical protein AVHY2522_23360 [Acidovorax sp. SUPP2522]
MSAELTLTTAMVLTGDSVYIAGAGDALENFAQFTRIVRYDSNCEPRWGRNDQDWRAVSLTYFGPQDEVFDDVLVLSEEGDVRYIGDHDPLLEKIPGAGVFSADAEGWGYLADIQQIGDCLYACGYKGQVYKRHGPNNWQHMDAGLLQDTRTTREQCIALSVINGPHESAIYAAGYQHAEWLPPKAFFFDGAQWREIELPPVADRIVNMYVESEARIWMCGSNGTLLLGNAEDGFKSLSSVDDNQLFTSVCKFQDKIYLASNMGLFVYDPADHGAGIQKVVTDLQPDLQDANIVDSYDKVLWSIGPKDIARFDGKRWERIDHPDNLPIR